MLKVATNEVFFMLDFEWVYAANDKPDVENISSQIMTIPIGLLLVVQPAVNLETGDIFLTLRPTISRVEKFVNDPAVAIKSDNTVQSKIPVVQVREMDSVLRLKSGQVVILGDSWKIVPITTVPQFLSWIRFPFWVSLAVGRMMKITSMSWLFS